MCRQGRQTRGEAAFEVACLGRGHCHEVPWEHVHQLPAEDRVRVGLKAKPKRGRESSDPLLDGFYFLAPLPLAWYRIPNYSNAVCSLSSSSHIPYHMIPLMEVENATFIAKCRYVSTRL